ncbi:unnamed protein product [Cylindrotheca closterium]|uniref:Uncharacterized protein n=1 Tax=Cylindrotheca closterium TaxID=2856 RepID=A0AAD2CKR7_9STRA|nr:unnamed protein product [Cylindrotheca closterium]
MADDQRVSSLSETQDIILCTLMIFSGVLSVFGSSTIVYRVLKNPTGTNSYVRIMLGLSFFDIVASIAFILTPFMLPAETSHRVWASGTAVTCSFLGWMTQPTFGVPFDLYREVRLGMRDSVNLHFYCSVVESLPRDSPPCFCLNLKDMAAGLRMFRETVGLKVAALDRPSVGFTED